MNRLIAIAIIFFISTTGRAFGTTPLLEVQVSSGGMVAFAGKYLYLRLFNNGRVDSEDINNIGHAIQRRRTRISPAHLKLLREFLKSENTRKLAAFYPPANPPLDHLKTIKISIHRDSYLQTVEILNYDFLRGMDKGLYPKSLLDFMCQIEKIRPDSPPRLTAHGLCTLFSKS